MNNNKIKIYRKGCCKTSVFVTTTLNLQEKSALGTIFPKSLTKLTGFCKRLSILPLILCFAAFISCENPEGGTLDKSAVPSANNNTFSISETGQRSVIINLTSNNTGEWKVYTGPEGGTSVWEISAFFQASLGTLTLTSFNESLQPGDYYVSVTEVGKIESGRMMIRLLYPSITPEVNEAQRTADVEYSTQDSVSFTLADSIEGVWKVYDTAEDTVSLADITPTVTGTTLNLTSSAAPFPGGDYYVAVTQNGRAESPRLCLTVNTYDANKTEKPKVVNDSVIKTKIPTVSVTYTLDNVSYTSPTWKIYDDVSGDKTVDGVNANLSGTTLTLSGTDIAVRTYYVSVTESEKVESSRLPLHVTLPDYVTFTVNNNTVDGTAENGTLFPLVKSNGTTLTYTPIGSKNVLEFKTGGSNTGGGTSEPPAGNDWIEIDPIAGAYLPEENWTMEMIVKDSVSGGSQMIDFLGANGKNGNGSFWLEMNTSYWLMRFYDTSVPGGNTNSNGNRGVRTARPQSGKWHHISYVRTGGTVTCYVDGVIATAALTGNDNDRKSSNNPSTYFRKLTDETPLSDKYLDNPLFSQITHCYIGVRANIGFHQFKMSNTAIPPEGNSDYYNTAKAIVASLNGE